MAAITINGITLDPVAEAPALASASLVAADASESNYILIQTAQPLEQTQKAELAEMGVRILEHVPERTYVAYYADRDLNAIRQLPYIDWANIYMRQFKVGPELLLAEDEEAPRVTSLVALASTSTPLFKHRPKTVDVVLHGNVNPEEVRTAIASAAHIDPEDLTMGRNKARVTVQSRYVSALARIDEVRHVEEVIPRKLLNDVARTIIRADVVAQTLSIEGDGQVVAVADTGFDIGSTTNVHPAFANRVVKLVALGRTGKANDPDGHGTHVAGSVLGDGTSAVLGTRIQGTAPKAKLILQSVLDANGGLNGLPSDLHDLFQDLYDDEEVRIHTNSWGSTRGDGKYDSQARELDDFVWNHRDFIVCFAAGNEGSDRQGTGRVAPQSITAPSTAKNCITVGACENDRPSFDLTYKDGWPSDFPANPIASDKVADNPEGMVAFSSRGPTQNQRFKPDVVAPGTFILSTLSRAVVSPNVGWSPSNDPLFFFDGGTSMATPLVAGAVALIREHLATSHDIHRPSAALVKAMLINGARDITGQYVPSESGAIPNNAEGFGRVDVAATIGPFSNGEELSLQDESTQLETNEEESTTITIGQAKLLKVTLVWTDPPGEALQNDLDLIVRAENGAERHGNVDPNSPDFDRVNNVEQVLWPDPPAGDFQVTVRAHRITQFPQSFALVIRTA